ncbi:MAG: hypothetical protein Q9223_006747, partial [Gallowayella weberi]
PRENTESDIERQTKRKRPNITNGSTVNGHAKLTPSTATVTNGTQHRTNGHATEDANSTTTNSQTTIHVTPPTIQNGAASVDKQRNGIPGPKNGHTVKMNGAAVAKKKKREE